MPPPAPPPKKTISLHAFFFSPPTRKLAARSLWRGAHLPLSHTHTPSQIFQNTLCIICWHKQSSQCLVCPLSICDNASVGSCSGGPASLCFSGSPVVLELSEGRKYALMSQVLSNTSVKVFFGTRTSLRPPQFFFFWRGGWATYSLPLLLCHL